MDSGLTKFHTMTHDHNSHSSFDLSYLNQVFQGNKQMINQIITMFIKQVPEYIEEMQNCVVRSDFEALHPLAHKAKSSIAMLGLKDMENLVLEIEKNSKYKTNEDELPELVGRALKECRGVSIQLESVLNE